MLTKQAEKDFKKMFGKDYSKPMKSNKRYRKYNWHSKKYKNKLKEFNKRAKTDLKSFLRYYDSNGYDVERIYSTAKPIYKLSRDKIGYELVLEFPYTEEVSINKLRKNGDLDPNYGYVIKDMFLGFDEDGNVKKSKTVQKVYHELEIKLFHSPKLPPYTIVLHSNYQIFPEFNSKTLGDIDVKKEFILDRLANIPKGIKYEVAGVYGARRSFNNQKVKENIEACFDTLEDRVVDTEWKQRPADLRVTKFLEKHPHYRPLCKKIYNETHFYSGNRLESKRKGVLKQDLKEITKTYNNYTEINEYNKDYIDTLFNFKDYVEPFYCDCDDCIKSFGEPIVIDETFNLHYSSIAELEKFEELSGKVKQNYEIWDYKY